MAAALALFGMSWFLTNRLISYTQRGGNDDIEVPINEITYDKGTFTNDTVKFIERLSPQEITDMLAKKQLPILNRDGYKLINQASKSEQFVDNERELKDLCTDIVVKQFLSSDSSLFNFMKLVYETFYLAIEQYKKLYGLDKWSIIFIYKGGNVLRIISNDFFRELPKMSSRRIQKYYEPFFKRSDADFSIYINPGLPNYDVVYNELTTLSYMLQVKIRQEINSNFNKYFDFTKFTQEYQSGILAKYYQQAQELDMFKNPQNEQFYNKQLEAILFSTASYPPTNNKYSGKKDVGIEFIRDKSVLGMYDINNKEYELFIQANKTLDFEAGGNRTRFNLIRTKILFNFIINGEVKKIGGELIDVSIPHKDDFNVGHFFEHTDYITKYQLQNGDQTLMFYSYSLKYLMSDLEYILFEFVKLPWNTPKYEKRLNRLFYLYFIDIFIVLKKNNYRRAIIQYLVKYIFNITLDEATLDADINTLKRNMRKLKINKSLKLNKLLVELSRIVDEIRRDASLLPENIISYNMMVNILLENCKYILMAFTGIDDYCSSDGNINIKILYNNEFSSLIGGK